MSLDLLLRSEAGAPLNAVQHDANLTDIETLFNSLEAAFGVALDADGTLKAGAVDNAGVIVDGIITLGKFAATTANVFLTTGPDGLLNGLGGVAGHVLYYNPSGTPSHVDPADLISDNTGIFGYDVPQLAVNETTTQSSWQALDLNSHIVALSAEDSTWVILQCEVLMDASTGASTPSSVLLRVSSNNTESTSSANTHRCFCEDRGGGNADVSLSASNTCQIWVKLSGTSIYYNAKIWVVGFVKL